MAVMPCPAAAAMHWAPAPVEHEKGHGGHDRSAGKAFVLVDGEGANLTLINPKLLEKPLASEGSSVTLKATGMGNYHALLARRSQAGLQESAIRYHYMNGKPSGTSPSLLIAHEKSALEIVPDPLAREHWRYYANTDARFIVRFQGKPLAGATVMMATTNGTTVGFMADADGNLSIPLPEDFAEVKAGRADNRPAEFVLTASHHDGDSRFVTTFSAAYHVNPEQWQSTGLGLATAGGGMLLGGVMIWRMRRRKEDK
ncbi:MAG: hypothetical protein COW62_14220 [Zetaproteobacteria bacterium CG17_big_fil_post_rev_8_21_14_2_50_50_13]|nr:MAG: hypothetical protein COW62_14220 [Zetaproteobacteria bacterium CG17_big_fil_post_rev_8_21_14_2_50_50_13]